MAEVATQFFITNDKPNVTGLVLAGSADFKTELSQSDMFDQRLQAKIIKVGINNLSFQTNIWQSRLAEASTWPNRLGAVGVPSRLAVCAV